jgi:hypothetical protein
MVQDGVIGWERNFGLIGDSIRSPFSASPEERWLIQRDYRLLGVIGRCEPMLPAFAALDVERMAASCACIRRVVR